jgi:hypothetical protein
LSKPGDFRFFPLKIWPNFEEKSFVEVALAFLLSPSDKSSPKQKEKLLEAPSNLRNVARTRMEALPRQAHWQRAGTEYKNCPALHSCLEVTKSLGCLSTSIGYL